MKFIHPLFELYTTENANYARILGGILNHGVPTSGMQNVYWHFCPSKVDRKYATGVVKLRNEILQTVKH